MIPRCLRFCTVKSKNPLPVSASSHSSRRSSSPPERRCVNNLSVSVVVLDACSHSSETKTEAAALTKCQTSLEVTLTLKCLNETHKHVEVLERTQRVRTRLHDSRKCFICMQKNIYTVIVGYIRQISVVVQEKYFETSWRQKQAGPWPDIFNHRLTCWMSALTGFLHTAKIAVQ